MKSINKITLTFITSLLLISSVFVAPIFADSNNTNIYKTDTGEVTTIIEILNDLKDSGLSQQITALYLYWQSQAVQMFNNTVAVQLWDKIVELAKSDSSFAQVLKEVWESNSTTSLATINGALATDVAIDVSYTIKGNQFFKKLLSFITIGTTIMVGVGSSYALNPNIIDTVNSSADLSLNYTPLTFNAFTCTLSKQSACDSYTNGYGIKLLIDVDARLLRYPNGADYGLGYIVVIPYDSLASYSSSTYVLSNYSGGLISTYIYVGAFTKVGNYSVYSTYYGNGSGSSSIYTPPIPVASSTSSMLWISQTFGGNSIISTPISFDVSTSSQVTIDQFNKILEDNGYSVDKVTSSTTKGLDDTTPTDEEGNVIDSVTTIDDLIKVIENWSQTSTDTNNYPSEEINTEYKEETAIETLSGLDSLSDLQSQEDYLTTDWGKQFTNNLNSIDSSCYSLPSCTLNGIKVVSNYASQVIESNSALKGTIVFSVLLGIVFMIF